MIDKADPLGFLAAQQRAAHQELLGLVDADQQRPDHRAAVPCNQADTRNVGIADARVFRHDRNVAQQRMGRRKADSVAIDRGDDRLVQFELAGDAAAADHRVMHLAFLENVAPGPLRHRLYIAADAEKVAGTGQHDDIDGVIVAQDRPRSFATRGSASD